MPQASAMSPGAPSPVPMPRIPGTRGTTARASPALFKSRGQTFPKAILPDILPMSPHRLRTCASSILNAVFFTMNSTASRRALIASHERRGAHSHSLNRRLPIGVTVLSSTDMSVPSFPRPLIPWSISRFLWVTASRRQKSRECLTERADTCRSSCLCVSFAYVSAAPAAMTAPSMPATPKPSRLETPKWLQRDSCAPSRSYHEAGTRVTVSGMLERCSSRSGGRSSGTMHSRGA